MKNFKYALKEDKTQKGYLALLKYIFSQFGLSGSINQQADAFIEKAKSNGIQWIQDSIFGFISSRKERIKNKDLTAGTLKNYVLVLKIFCEMNDDMIPGTINWKKIVRGLPKVKSNANDRAITKEEIRKLAEYSYDRRVKPIALAMSSSGFRLGAWEDLSWKHVEPITKWEYLTWKKKREQEQEENNDGHSDIVLQESDKQKIIAAKLTVYDEDREEYYTFITVEAYEALKNYMDFRQFMGEPINGDSYLLRDDLPESDVKHRSGWGFATKPVRLSEDGIKKVLTRAYYAQGIRQKLPNGKRRHPFKLSHGFRKYFDTTIEEVEGMRAINVSILMNHQSGIPKHYRRPQMMFVLDDYLKAVDALSIFSDPSKAAMQKQIDESREKDHNILGKLAEKEKEMQSFKDEFSLFKQNLVEMSNIWEEMGQVLKERREMEKSAGIEFPSSSSSVDDFLQHVKELRKLNSG